MSLALVLSRMPPLNETAIKADEADVMRILLATDIHLGSIVYRKKMKYRYAIIAHY